MKSKTTEIKLPTKRRPPFFRKSGNITTRKPDPTNTETRTYGPATHFATLQTGLDHGEVKGLYIALGISIFFTVFLFALVTTLWICMGTLFGGCRKCTSRVWSSVCNPMKKRRDDHDKDSDADMNSLSSMVMFDQTILTEADEIVQPKIPMETLRPRLHDKYA